MGFGAFDGSETGTTGAACSSTGFSVGTVCRVGDDANGELGFKVAVSMVAQGDALSLFTLRKYSAIVRVAKSASPVRSSILPTAVMCWPKSVFES